MFANVRFSEFRLLVIAFSLLTAFCNALSAVLVSIGMKNSNPNSANFFMALSQVVVLSGLLFMEMPVINLSALGYFVLSGICANCVARLLNFVSVKRIGVATTSAIVGTSPLLSTVLAILFLGEEIISAVILGAVLVVVGIYLISGAHDTLSIKSIGLIIPLLSATFYAASNIFRKMGLNFQAHSVLGAQSSTAAGLAFFSLYLISRKQLGNIKTGERSLAYYIIAGIVGSVGWVSIMLAMNMGSVSVVGTIVFSYPLLSLLLSWMFLKEEETITPRIILGCVTIVLGIILVTLA